MPEIIKGFAFHCHHKKLVEFVFDYQERVDYITSYKPESEQALRLRLFKMIPDDRLPEKESPEWNAFGKAIAAYDKARVAYNKARVAYENKYEAEFEALHRELCPACPWNGKTIFKEEVSNA